MESNRFVRNPAALFAFLPYFFLSLPQIDIRLVESTTAQTIRVESSGIESIRQKSRSPFRVLTLFFSKSPTNRHPLSRIDYSTDDSSRIESNRVDSSIFLAALFAFLPYFFLKSPANRLPLSRIDYNIDDSSRIESIRQNFWPPYSRSYPIFF